MKTKGKTLPFKNLPAAILSAACMFLSAGCLIIPKEIQEAYVSDLAVCETMSSGQTEIRIAGSYGESAWGIDTLNAVRENDAIRISGMLRYRAPGKIDFKLKVPDGVNEVYFCSRKIWSRDNTEAKTR